MKREWVREKEKKNYYERNEFCFAKKRLLLDWISIKKCAMDQLKYKDQISKLSNKIYQKKFDKKICMKICSLMIENFLKKSWKYSLISLNLLKYLNCDQS